VADQPFLGRLVVVGGDQQHAVGPGLLGLLGELDRLGGGVGAGAGNDRNPPLHLVDDGLDHVHMLVVVKRRCLAGGAARHDGIGAALNLELHQLAQLLEVHLAVVERGNDGDNASFEHILFLPWLELNLQKRRDSLAFDHFFDGFAFANHFEPVLRYYPSATGGRLLHELLMAHFVQSSAGIKMRGV